MRGRGGGPKNDRVRAALALALTAVLGAGCVQLGVVSDGTTVSWGPANEGILIAGAQLPLAGDGYIVRATWAARDTQWGIDELIAVVAWTAREVARTHPDTVLAVGDMSIPGGGRSAHHRSHQSGRDVDMLLFGAQDGHHLPATAMVPYSAAGTLLADPKVVFDAERNWTVVRGLLGAPGPGVANIFLYAPLRDLLLDHARAIGEPESLIELAATVISQPSDSALHDDHMHVRIYCPRGEPTCRDYAIRLAAKKPRPSGPFRTLASIIGRKPITGGLLRARPRW